MSVRDNLEVGSLGARGGNRRDRLAAVLDAFPVLKLKLDRLGGTLSGGEQQTLVIGRSLMAQPRVLLMDEPSLGLSPRVIEQLAGALRLIRHDWGTTLLVAEQSILLASEIASTFYVLRLGTVTYNGQGDMQTLVKVVHQAYLGSRKE
jgi:branched-chain amino acid transport system ATP-binding protein